MITVDSVRSGMTRRSPIDEIERAFDRMSRELAAVGDEFEPTLRRGPNVDVATRDSEVVVVVDLPGFDVEDIDVSLVDRDLTITAERDETVEVGDDETTFHRRERRQRSVQRRVQLPEEVVDDETTATYENGVLTVTLATPDHDDVDGTTIEVN